MRQKATPPMAAAATMPAAVPAAGTAEELWWRFAATGEDVGSGRGITALATVDDCPVVVVAVAVADRCRLGGFVVGVADTPACDESSGGASEVLDV